MVGEWEEWKGGGLPRGCVPCCPGCAPDMASAAEERDRKMAWLEKSLAPWKNRLEDLRDGPEEQRWGYRDKVCLRAAWLPETGWALGLRRKDGLVAIPECPRHSRRVRNMISWLRHHLPAAENFPLVYYVQAGGQGTLVLKSREDPDLSWMETAPDPGEAAGLEGLWLHRHPGAGRRVFGRGSWRLLWGVPRSRDAQGLVYGPRSFQQIRPSLHLEALERAEAFLSPKPGDGVVDLCCGTGGSLRRWRERGAMALGVEMGGESLECAAVNVPGATLLRGSCAQRLPQVERWLEAFAPERRLFYVNPPRLGLEPEVGAWMGSRGSFARGAYLSCSAGTLARDLKVLEREGFAVVSLHPYDFFPGTPHVEVLVCLHRR
ncbi:MAG TPA: class I SAM-dependent RNA methyltransferase [Synergistaceae bacterium]|nr:class I SAM-dependent RNA methyltransferase [Synergistaceae bacterium]